MPSIDELFHLTSSQAGGKRKLEDVDAQEIYKSAKLTTDGDAKGLTNGAAEIQDDSDEAGPELPPDDPDADDEGRFFGGGVTRNTTDALDYLDAADEEPYTEEKIDTAWIKRLVTNLERKINRNSEQRARFEAQPEKFMASEADLDAEIKGLSILTEHPEFYKDFTDGAGLLVGLLAHDNTDIAINAIEIISELVDEDVQAEQEQWDVLVDAMLEADLLGLLVSNFERFDEGGNESDRQGVYHSLSVLEGLASQTTVAEKSGNQAVLQYLLSRIQVKEPVGQNKQYAAEVLQVLLQISRTIRRRLVKLQGVDVLLELLSSYRKRDPEKDSQEEEYAEDIFDALTCIVEEAEGKQAFINGEGMELMLLMLKEGKFSKPRALKVIDHACSGQSEKVCSRLVEAAGLKTIFGAFTKKPDHSTTEHLLGIFSALLRSLPGDSAPRIRTLGKFVEKEYEKIDRLVKLRREYAVKVAAVDAEITNERKALSVEEQGDRLEEWYSRRLDAGLYCLQTVNIILAWLVAEDSGAKEKIRQLLAERDESLETLKIALESQLAESDHNQDETAAEMIHALMDCM